MVVGCRLAEHKELPQRGSGVACLAVPSAGGAAGDRLEGTPRRDAATRRAATLRNGLVRIQAIDDIHGKWRLNAAMREHDADEG